jgi:hypothetical protein
LQNARNSATPGPSNTGPQPVSTTQVSEDGSSSETQTQPCSTVERVPTSVDIPRPKPRPTGKGKAKATEVGTTGESQITSNGSTTMPAAPRSMPKPRPITRAKRKLATVEKASTSLENVPESGVPTSDNMQNTPRRGSKRGHITQLDEVPVPKKRKTQAPKPVSIPASEPVDPASASMSLPQSADSTSPAIDADEVIQDEHVPAPTIKKTFTKTSNNYLLRSKGKKREKFVRAL